MVNDRLLFPKLNIETIIQQCLATEYVMSPVIKIITLLLQFTTIMTLIIKHNKCMVTANQKMTGTHRVLPLLASVVVAGP